jgi:hypothetical protein
VIFYVCSPVPQPIRSSSTVLPVRANIVKRHTHLQDSLNPRTSRHYPPGSAPAGVSLLRNLALDFNDRWECSLTMTGTSPPEAELLISSTPPVDSSLMLIRPMTWEGDSIVCKWWTVSNIFLFTPTRRRAGLQVDGTGWRMRARALPSKCLRLPADEWPRSLCCLRRPSCTGVTAGWMPGPAGSRRRRPAKPAGD